MAKAIVIVLGILLAAQGIPDKLASDNYDEVKEFIQGFMDGYNNRKMNLSSRCLDSSSQTKLDQIIVAMLHDFTKGDVVAAMREVENLTDEVSEIFEDCGLDEIAQKFNEDIKEKGAIWLTNRIFLNFFEIEKRLGLMIEYLLEGKWYKAGDAFGEMMEYIVPLNPKYSSPEVNDYSEFVEGILLGLCKHPNKPGQCYTALEGTKDELTAVIEDVAGFLTGAKSITDIYADAMKFYGSVKKLDGNVCDFKKLVNAITTLNMDKLMANYFRNMMGINKSANDLKTCVPDYKKCGTDIGELLRMIVGWSLN